MPPADHTAVSGGRGPRTPTHLLRYGFVDVTKAADLLGPTGLGVWSPATSASDEPEALLEALARTAAPDLALRQLHRLDEASPALMPALQRDSELRSRLFSVLGASVALGDHLVANPAEWQALAQPGIDLGEKAVSEAEITAITPRSTTAPAGVAALRLEYRRELLI